MADTNFEFSQKKVQKALLKANNDPKLALFNLTKKKKETLEVATKFGDQMSELKLKFPEIKESKLLCMLRKAQGNLETAV